MDMSTNYDGSHGFDATNATKKRSHHELYYRAFTHPQDEQEQQSNASFSNTNHHVSSSIINNNKRARRFQEKEELQYAVATLERVMEDAGHSTRSVRHASSISLAQRRERALPAGSVDTSSVRVMTSREFDEEEGNDVIEAVTAGHNADSRRSDVDRSDKRQEKEANNHYDLMSMYTMSGLLQSTRHSYGFSSSSSSNKNKVTKETSTTSPTLSISNVAISQNRYKNNNDEKPGEESSGSENNSSLSSWTPSSSCNDLMNDNERKNIDNDNRSDGQSSIDEGAGSSPSTSPRLRKEQGEEEGAMAANAAAGPKSSSGEISISSLSSLPRRGGPAFWEGMFYKVVG